MVDEGASFPSSVHRYLYAYSVSFFSSVFACLPRWHLLPICEFWLDVSLMVYSEEHSGLLSMCNHDLDPDIGRWGLDLIDVCCLPHAGSYSVTRHETVSCPVGLVMEGYRDESISCSVGHFMEGSHENEETGNVNVESDEVIAQTLQEEFTRLASIEASGPLDANKEHLQASISSQDWHAPSKRHFNIGDQIGEEDVGHEIGISCLSSGETSVSGTDCSCFLEIDDESTLDGEVGKRLDNMVSVPHVPKINGDIPTMDEEISDHQRLLDRLNLYDLVEFKVQGDGNCQFRALSDQIYRTQDHHKFVRQQVVNQLTSCPEVYGGYVPMAYDEYLKKTSRNGEWGDHVTLQAAADSYGLKIFVLTSFKDTCCTEILPRVRKSDRVIFLSFWAEVHYNSIYPAGDTPSFENSKRKKWWIF